MSSRTLVVAMLACLPQVATGQTLAPGARVRVTVPCPSAGGQLCTQVGNLLATGADGVRIALADSTASYGRASLRRLEVSRGVRSHRLIGAGIGFLVGAGATYVVLNSGGSTASCDRGANQDAMSAGECLALTAAGGVAGAGLGVLVGSLIRSERWEEVPLDRLRLSFVPQRGWRVAVSLSF